MSVVIQDANIIIDLIACEIFDDFFKLDIEVYTSSLVLDEIIRPDQKALCEHVVHQNQLKVVEINTLEYLQLQAMEANGLSVQDRSVLKLAKDRVATLLTGDGKLRRMARAQAVEVCGILWVFDALVEQAICSRSDAVIKLRLLKDSNIRLPVNEIDKRIREWSE